MIEEFDKEIGLNDKQLTFANHVIRAVNGSTEQRLFFLNGSSGTGKTFVLNVLIRQLRKHGTEVLAVAATGNAASLLDGGTTAQSGFCKLLAQQKHTHSTKNIEDLNILPDVIICDEALMLQCEKLQEISACLQTTNQTQMFGGKIVILGGDLKKLLPVSARIQNSHENSILSLFQFKNEFVSFTLTENMRIETDIRYIEKLEQIGVGRHDLATNADISRFKGLVYLPREIVSHDVDTVLNFVYPFKTLKEKNVISYQLSVVNVAIITPTNYFVEVYNNQLNSKLIESEKCYNGADNGLDESSAFGEKPDLITKFETKHNYPPLNLTLKKNSIVMLTRKFDDYCTGTRMIVEELQTDKIVCRIITNLIKMEEVVEVTRINHLPFNDYSPSFTRYQFPLKLAFAMTIHQSQGQTFGRVGIMLNKPCFAHGQLYSALSTVSSPDNVLVYMPPRHNAQNTTSTENVVYPEVFKITKSMKQL